MGTSRNGDRSGPDDFRAATKGLSPALRDALHKAATRHGVQEDDPFWGVMAAQAELLQAFLTDHRDALEEGNQRLGQLDKRLEQLIATSREAALSRREQQEALRQDEQKARDKHLQATEAGFAALRDELDKAKRWHLATVGIAVGLTAALCIGGMAWRHDQAEKAEQAQRDVAQQAVEQSDEGLWWHNLRATQAGLRFMLGDQDSNGVSRRLVLTVSPGKDPRSWKLQAANLDAGGNAVLTFRKPEPGAAEAAAAAARHR